MREGLKDDRYNVRMAPPVPLVPRAPPHRRAGADALRRHGRPRSSPPPRSRRAVEAAAKTAPMPSPSATCTPIGTRNTRPRPRRRWPSGLPNAYVSLSSEVLPQIKEYERVWTTVVNAYVGPVLVELPVAAQRAAAGRGLCRRRDDHAVARRRRADRGVEPHRGRRRAVRAPPAVSPPARSRRGCSPRGA